MSKNQEETWCAHCKQGPYNGVHGLKIHTSLKHDEAEPEKIDAMCCNGETDITCGSNREFCAVCGRILEDR